MKLYIIIEDNRRVVAVLDNLDSIRQYLDPEAWISSYQILYVHLNKKIEHPIE
jgi:hypothetical protein